MNKTLRGIRKRMLWLCRSILATKAWTIILATKIAFYRNAWASNRWVQKRSESSLWKLQVKTSGGWDTWNLWTIAASEANVWFPTSTDRLNMTKNILCSSSNTRPRIRSYSTKGEGTQPFGNLLGTTWALWRSWRLRLRWTSTNLSHLWHLWHPHPCHIQTTRTTTATRLTWSLTLPQLQVQWVPVGNRSNSESNWLLFDIFRFQYQEETVGHLSLSQKKIVWPHAQVHCPMARRALTSALWTQKPMYRTTIPCPCSGRPPWQTLKRLLPSECSR